MRAASASIEIRNLTKTYGGIAVVDDVSFDVAPGEFLTLLGPSGCGKTTTLRCIAGFNKPDGGAIRIDGNDVSEVPPYRRHLGMVFQSYALFPHLTVYENIAFGLHIRSVSRAETMERVSKALDMVQLSGMEERLPKQLSGGQQQRVALARALIYEPRVLLLDEPLSNLDAKLRVQMRNEIRILQQTLGVTAVYVTHDQEEALSISDRIAVMNRGKLEQLSAPWDIYNRPQTLFTASFVGAANVLPAEVAMTNGSEVRLVVAGGLELALCGERPPPGSNVWAIVRPEAVVVEPAAKARPITRGRSGP